MPDYKALTTLNLPFTETMKKPGDTVTEQELADAQQNDTAIKALVDSGALGSADAELHPSTIVPDPGMPTIQSVVAEAQAAIEKLEEIGEEVPDELRTVANLDTTHVTTADDTPSGGDKS